MNGSANTTALEINAANVTLSGSGTLTLSNFASNIIGGSSGTDVLTNQETIQGAGNIGVGQIGLNNQGTIDANQSVGMTLQVSSAGGTNTGTLEASAGSKLTFLGGTYANAGGTILNNASTILFDGGVTINGGTITQTGAGLIQLANVTINTALANNGTSTIEVIGGGNTVSGTLTNPAGGQLKLDNGGVLNITGSSIVNNGTFTMNGSANTTALEINAANVTLSGSGTLTLSNFASNIIGGSSGTDVLTNQETIQGAGNIGVGQIGLNNQGTIDANQSVGMTLQVSSAGGTNTGTLEATAGATLTVLGGTYTQTGSGKFLASGANSEVLLDAASITGGTLTATSGGKFVAENNSTLTGLSISSGTSVNLLNGNVLHLGVGTITSKGTINVGSTGNFTALSLNGNVTLAGTGKIIFSGNANNFILGSGTLTNQETIEGEGNIGDGQIGLVNTGSILANETGTHTPSTLFIDTNSSGFSNSSGAKNGILNVSAKNTIIIEGGPFNNFSGGTLTGGEYLVSGELEFNASSATGIVTNNATITLTGATAEILNTFNSTNALTSFATNGAGATFGLAGGAKFVTSGNFTNNGTLNIGSGDKFSVGTNGANNLTNFNSGTSTLTGGTYIVGGTGQIQFNNGGDASDIVTNDANITLTSTSATNSFIDQSGNNALANFATNGATGSFTLTTDRNFTTGGSFTNAGIVTVSKSTGAGHTQLTINGGYSQTGGTTMVDGLLTTSTGIDISGGFFYGNADTLTGNFDLTGGTLNPGDGLKKIGDVNITGSYTESGAGILNIDLDGITAGTKYDVLNISGAATLGGHAQRRSVHRFHADGGRCIRHHQLFFGDRQLHDGESADRPRGRSLDVRLRSDGLHAHTEQRPGGSERHQHAQQRSFTGKARSGGSQRGDYGRQHACSHGDSHAGGDLRRFSNVRFARLRARSGFGNREWQIRACGGIARNDGRCSAQQCGVGSHPTQQHRNRARGRVARTSHVGHICGAALHLRVHARRYDAHHGLPLNFTGSHKFFYGPRGASEMVSPLLVVPNLYLAAERRRRSSWNVQDAQVPST